MRARSSQASSGVTVGPGRCQGGSKSTPGSEARSVGLSCVTKRQQMMLMAHGARRPVAPGSVPSQRSAPQLPGAPSCSGHAVRQSLIAAFRLTATVLNEHAWSWQPECGQSRTRSQASCRANRQLVQWHWQAQRTRMFGARQANAMTRSAGQEMVRGQSSGVN